MSGVLAFLDVLQDQLSSLLGTKPCWDMVPRELPWLRHGSARSPS